MQPRSTAIRTYLCRRALLCLVSVTLFSKPALAEDWKVTLTAEQNQKFQEMKNKPARSVFALSPDSAWGRTWGYKSLDDAKERALAFCRENLRRGHRDCLVFAVDGKVVAKPVVPTKVVQNLYKPVNGRKAAAFFGVKGISFQGNPSAAKAQWDALQRDPNKIASFTVNKSLGRQLLGTSLVTDKKPSFSVALSKFGARQALQADSGVLAINYPDWSVTNEGLLCMSGGAWESTGKQVGTKCLILESIDNGLVRFDWASRNSSFRKGAIVAGDAGRASAK
ncbi:MAG: hypothetical protein WBC85_02450 [Planktotalea sp.]|uniref:hypothetical protein n=1 Tax=Planktotalea sp. TaxID=2029877 RepID=UPI003C77D594